MEVEHSDETSMALIADSGNVYVLESNFVKSCGIITSVFK